MSWLEDVNELERQAEMAKQMGGEDSIAFHHGQGKLTVRERIDLLQDADSFIEISTLAGSTTWHGAKLESLKPSNTVIGSCQVNGRKVALSGGDFTIRGGAADAAIGDKSRFIEQYALDTRIPYIKLLDATGGSVKTFKKIDRTYLPEGVGAGLGPQTGIAYRP